MNPEAIEAAARASWAQFNPEPWAEGSPDARKIFLDDAKVQLEAAAPYLIREARAAELEAAAEQYGPAQLTGLFFGRDGYTKAWLSARAAAIRAGEA